MKRFVVLLLVLSLLCSLTIPVFATEDTATEHPPISFDPQDLDIRDADSFTPDFCRAGEPAKRDKTEDNLAFPGPLAKEQSFTPNGNQAVSLGVIQTGKTGQYFCVFLYEGKEPKGEPVSTVVESFRSEIGYFTRSVYFYFKNLPTGRYTLVTCTAEDRGNGLSPVDGTAFMTDVYCYESYQMRWQLFLQDPQTKQRVKPVNLAVGQDLTLEVGRSPLPSDGSGGILVTCDPDLVHVEEAGGYIFLYGLRCGSGKLTITHRSSKVINIPIHVCAREGGHLIGETYDALLPTAEEKGLCVKVCKECGTIYREEVPSLTKTFEGLTDVSAEAWYYDSVREAVLRNLFKGVTATQFKPGQAMTRAMLVTVLWRMEGCPVADGGDFTDVAPDDWYAQAVNWAAQNRIVNGVGQGKFNPNGAITREQMAAILYRYADGLGLLAAYDSSIDSFPDRGQVSSWAVDPMTWAYAMGFVTGVKEGSTVYLRPLGSATRSQVSAILIRFIHAYEAPPPKVEYPDPADYLDYGQWEGLYWAFYPDGRLVIGGEGSHPGDSVGFAPWHSYRDQITALELLYGIESVGNYAFDGYSNLQSVIMADSVTTIYDGAFKNCTALENLVLSRNLVDILSHAFEGCSSLAHVDLPYGLRSVGFRAFSGCTALKEIILPDSIVGGATGSEYSHYSSYVNRGAFEGCSSLEYVVMPIAEPVVMVDVFRGCTSLKEVILPLSVESIGTGAFENCSSLESITIMPGLNQIQEGAFAHCTSLKEVYILSYRYNVDNNPSATNNTEGDFPFGSPSRVTLYGIADSTTESIAQYRGYTFVDIATIME